MVSARILSSLALCLSIVHAAPTTTPPSQQPNPQIAIQDEANFCLFLPPQPGLDVALYETQGVPFCMGSVAVDGARQMPEGFVTVAHYQKSATYEQVTGYIDRSKYSLSVDDGGGQYDNHGNGKPTGAQCQGYSYFVGMIEPSSNRFCMRCCQNPEDCPTGRSQYGCLRIIEGDYTGNQTDPAAPAPSDGSAPSPPPPADSAGGSTPTTAAGSDGSNASATPSSSPAPSTSASSPNVSTSPSTVPSDTTEQANANTAADSSNANGGTDPLSVGGPPM